MIRLIIISVFIIILKATLFGQCNYVNNTFKSGEKVTYLVYYKLGFMWFNAAQASFQVKSETYQNKMAFHFESNGSTKPNYDWIYKVRDYYNSYADQENLSPLFFSRITSEGSYQVNNQYRFDYNSNRIYSSIENSETPKYKDTLTIQNCTLDVLTAIYACRTIDVKPLKINDTIPLNMVVDNEIYNLYLRYLGIQSVETYNGQKYRCRKFTILMVAGTIFSGGEDILVWISDDRAKIPIKVEAKILVGSIIAYVDEVSANKWPLSSMINDIPGKQ